MNFWEWSTENILVFWLQRLPKDLSKSEIKICSDLNFPRARQDFLRWTPTPMFESSRPKDSISSSFVKVTLKCCCTVIPTYEYTNAKICFVFFFFWIFVVLLFLWSFSTTTRTRMHLIIILAFIWVETVRVTREWEIYPNPSVFHNITMHYARWHYNYYILFHFSTLLLFLFFFCMCEGSFLRIFFDEVSAAFKSKPQKVWTLQKINKIHFNSVAQEGNFTHF